MKVILKQDWFAPGSPHTPSGAKEAQTGHLYRRGDAGTVHDIPDHLRKFLPSTADIVGEKRGEKPAKVAADKAEAPSRDDKTPSLRDFDDSRAAADAESDINEQAEAAHQRNVAAGTRKPRSN